MSGSKNLAEHDPKATSRILEEYQEQFINTLNHSNQDPQAASEKLWEIFNEAYDYARTEKTGEAVEPKNITEEDFHQIAEMNEERRRFEVNRMVQESWKESTEILNEMYQEKDTDYRGASEACRIMEELHQKAIMETMEKQDHDTFRLIAENIGASRDEFTSSLNDATGFIKMEDYEQITLPEKFISGEDADAYAALNGYLLEKIKEKNSENGNNDAMSAMSHQAASELYRELNQEIQMVSHLENIVPNLSEEYERMHRIAQGLDYIMQPRDNGAENGAENEKRSTAHATQAGPEQAAAMAQPNNTP